MALIISNQSWQGFEYKLVWVIQFFTEGEASRDSLIFLINSASTIQNKWF